MAGVQVTDDDTELEPLDEMQVQHEVFARFLASEVSLFRENLETFGKELRESLQALKQELAKQVRAEAERTGRSLEQRLMVALEDRVTDLRQTLTGTQQGTQEGDPGLKPAGSRVASPGPSSPRPGSSVMRSLSPPALANPPVPSSTAAETSQRRSPLTLLLDEHVSDITVVSDDDEREGETLSMSQMRTSQKTTFLPQAAGGPNLTQGSAATRTATSLEDLPPQLASALAQHMTDTPSHSREKLSPLQNAFFMHQMEVLNITDTRLLIPNAERIHQRGIRANIWTPDWTPQGTKSMPDYLGEKIKTAVRRKRRSDDLMQQLVASSTNAKKRLFKQN